MESSRPGGDTDASQKTVTLKRDIERNAYWDTPEGKAKREVTLQPNAKNSPAHPSCLLTYPRYQRRPSPTAGSCASSVNESLAQAGISLFIIPIRGFGNILGYFWQDPEAAAHARSASSLLRNPSRSKAEDGLLKYRFQRSSRSRCSSSVVSRESMSRASWTNSSSISCNFSRAESARTSGRSDSVIPREG